jgi:UDP-N-acetyl-D-mannosaminuronic acid dehydrogenase
MLNESATIREALREMSSGSTDTPGLRVVVDAKGHLIGTVSDGDIRRAINRGVELNERVLTIATNNPMWVSIGSIASMRREFLRKLHHSKTSIDKYKYVAVVDELHHFVRCVSTKSLLDVPIEERRVAVIGLGFVGLTLAASLASVGVQVVGTDVDPQIIEELRIGKPHFFENGLEQLLRQPEVLKNLEFEYATSSLEADVYIVTVGTPINAAGQPDLEPLQAALNRVRSELKYGDLVILRSTVPVGTCRSLGLLILESSGLAVGKDFHIAFAPERTIEGNALEELRTLPQIVGGIDSSSAGLAERIFRKLTHSVVVVDNIEIAEMIKLINNTYRATAFAFANEVALMCDRFNVVARDVIRLANEGYPRSQVAAPSPGVGGICLEKDPVLFSYDVKTARFSGQFGLVSRDVNERAINAIIDKVQVFAAYVGTTVDNLRVLILGVAFKGNPETSDTRSSISLSVLERLPNVRNVVLADCVLTELEGLEHGVQFVGKNVAASLDSADALLILNNHQLHPKIVTFDALRNRQKELLIYDGWGQLSRHEMEQYKFVTYATPGYMGMR